MTMKQTNERRAEYKTHVFRNKYHEIELLFHND